MDAESAPGGSDSDLESTRASPVASELPPFVQPQFFSGIELVETEPPKQVKSAVHPPADYDYGDRSQRKGLDWNVIDPTYRQDYLRDVAEIKRIVGLRPGMKVLGWIPRKAYYHFKYNPEDQNYYPYGLNLEAFDVQEISVIRALPNLRFLNLSSNRLRQESLEVVKYLPNLTSLKLDNNRLNSINIPATNLKQLTLRKNRLVAIDAFTLPQLEFLALDKNRIKLIELIDSSTTPDLIYLSMADNRLKTTKSDLPVNLRSLFLGNNKIRRLEGLEGLVNLRTLHLRGNRIKKLDGLVAQLQNLKYLNVRDNKISNVKQVKKLRVLPRLETLVTTGNPFEASRDEDANRQAIVYALRRLKRLNKREVTLQDVTDSVNGRQLIDNEDDSSDDAIPEDGEEEEDETKVPPEWEDDDDLLYEKFNPFKRAQEIALNSPMV